MNDLGMLLTGTVVRVTVLALVGAVLAALFRRRGPAAGSLAAMATLTGLVAVSALSLSPWPRFWTLDLGPAPAVHVEGVRGVAPVPVPAPAPAQRAGSTFDWEAARTFAREFASALRNPPAPDIAAAPAAAGLRAWRWPAWVAAGLLAAWTLGLARLALALRAVGGVRRRSRAIDDRGLNEEVACLRAELGLARPVALRVSDELTAPATVGWLRPAVLLPPDWPGWDAPERRAVLSHELAHVQRGDYSSGLWAQLCLALHVYHPLAHWLVARLRLDQELVADACGARLAGGNQPYLAALARLALRRSEPPAVRLARPFLPSRNAFLRRLEMLRDAKTDPVRTGPLPPLGRWLTAAALAAVALAVSGLRGPAGLPSARAQQAQAGADDRKAELQKKVRELNDQLREIERQEAAKAARPGGFYDLSHAPAETVLAVVGHTVDILTRPEFKPITDQMNQGRPTPLIDLRADEIEWMKVFLLRHAGAPGQTRPLMVLYTTKPQDRKALAARLNGRPEEAHHSGQVYFRAEGGSRDSYFMPDDRTIVIGDEDAVISLIDARAQDGPIAHPWDAAWAKLATKGQVAVALDPAWLAAAMPKNPPPGTPQAALGVYSGAIAPLLDKATGYAATVSLRRELEVDVVATCPTIEDADSVRQTLLALTILGKNAVHELKRRIGEVAPAQRQATVGVLDLVESLLAQAGPMQSGDDPDKRVVRFFTHTDKDAAAVVRVLLLLPATDVARTAARQAQSMNNMKMLGLGMHNYNSANGHFPPAVLRGPDGKTPYSWRVALLPYVEQNPLFKQYDLNEPWDSPKNRKVLEQMPDVYRHPTDTREGHYAAYFVPVGTDTLFPPGGTGATVSSIRDGAAYTLMLVEAKRDIPWTKPEDIPVTARSDRTVPELGGFTPGSFLGCMADGSVGPFSLTINPITLKALFTSAGGEVISLDTLDATPARLRTAPNPTPPPTPRR